MHILDCHEAFCPRSTKLQYRAIENRDVRFRYYPGLAQSSPNARVLCKSPYLTWTPPPIAPVYHQTLKRRDENRHILLNETGGENKTSEINVAFSTKEYGNHTRDEGDD